MLKIGITMGDPAGIGPEICLQAINHPTVLATCQPIIFGDVALLKRVAEQCELALPQQVISSSHALDSLRTEPSILQTGNLSSASVQPGKVNAETGRSAFQYVDAAIDAALQGEIDAIATGPLHKEALHAADIPYPGHTELLAAKTNCSNACMMLTSPEITCSLVTTHVGYSQVPTELTSERIFQVIELSHQAMQRMRGINPAIAVCGLNPHAGEAGLFGNLEEEHIILPAIRKAQEQGIQVSGPLPPDTAFVPARRRVTDCFVCMYHDQGLIPLKALAFDVAVNVTLGLPIVRTSVDHGTALDLAWQGTASCSSMVQAILLAAKLAKSPQPAESV